MKLQRRKISVIGTVLVFLFVILTMTPLIIMVLGAIKPNTSLIQIPMDLNPLTGATTDNIKRVLTESDIFLWLKNSLVLSLSVALLTVFVGITGGYAFAKISFRGKGLLFALVMATMMMPKQMLMVPNFMVASDLKLTNTMIGLILTSIAPAFGVFLSRQFITNLPSELFDAAEIDGCGEVRKFFHVVLPLMSPAAGTIGIFSFFATFNDYVWQMIMISDKKLQTLPIGIGLFSGKTLNNMAVNLAFALLASIPMVIIFLLCQKMFIKGATVGAVKG